MDITTGLEINLNNPVELHNSIERIREARNRMGKTDINCIVLCWNEDGGETHRIPIIVEGPNLWVIGYLFGDETVYFEKRRGDGTLRYSSEDEADGLRLQSAKVILKRFEGEFHLTNFQKVKGNECARSAYVMAVFIVSEIVRNEVLELIFLCGSMNSAPFVKKWSDFLFVYREWERAARVLYPEEAGAICPVIRVKGLRSRCSNLEKDENLQIIKAAYGELMNLITNIVVTEDNEEEYKGLMRLMGLTIRQRES